MVEGSRGIQREPMFFFYWLECFRITAGAQNSQSNVIKLVILRQFEVWTPLWFFLMTLSENVPSRPRFSCSSAIADLCRTTNPRNHNTTTVTAHATLILWPRSSGSCHHSRNGSAKLGLVSLRKLSQWAQVSVCQWTALFHSDHKDIKMWQTCRRQCCNPSHFWCTWIVRETWPASGFLVARQHVCV